MNIHGKFLLVGLAGIFFAPTAFAQTLPAQPTAEPPRQEKAPEDRFARVQDSLDQAARVLAKGSAEAAKTSGDAPFSALQSVALQTKAPRPKAPPLAAGRCPEGKNWICAQEVCIHMGLDGYCKQWLPVDCACR